MFLGDRVTVTLLHQNFLRPALPLGDGHTTMVPDRCGGAGTVQPDMRNTLQLASSPEEQTRLAAAVHV